MSLTQAIAWLMITDGNFQDGTIFTAQKVKSALLRHNFDFNWDAITACLRSLIRQTGGLRKYEVRMRRVEGIGHRVRYFTYQMSQGTSQSLPWKRLVFRSKNVHKQLPANLRMPKKLKTERVTKEPAKVISKQCELFVGRVPPDLQTRIQRIIEGLEAKCILLDERNDALNGELNVVLGREEKALRDLEHVRNTFEAHVARLNSKIADLNGQMSTIKNAKRQIEQREENWEKLAREREQRCKALDGQLSDLRGAHEELKREFNARSDNPKEFISFLDRVEKTIPVNEATT
jgi:hypothetical protein